MKCARVLGVFYGHRGLAICGLWFGLASTALAKTCKNFLPSSGSATANAGVGRKCRMESYKKEQFHNAKKALLQQESSDCSNAPIELWEPWSSPVNDLHIRLRSYLGVVYRKCQTRR
jgi:hypothetical protein